MEAVVAERARVGPEHRAGLGGQVDHGAAGRAARRGLRAGHPPADQPTTCRSGGAIARTAPRSGQVPTTTSTPGLAQPAHRGAEVGRGLGRAGAGAVASLAPTRITATSGRSPSSARATWVARSVEREPATPTLDSCTRRPVGALGEQPGELAADGVLDSRSTPTPSAVESPSSTSRSGGASARPTVARRARPSSGLAYRRVRAATASAGEQRGAADRAGEQRDRRALPTRRPRGSCASSRHARSTAA